MKLGSQCGLRIVRHYLCLYFDVSLTVHLSITQSMYQLDAPVHLLFI
jgi:hypothetical protein